MGLTILDKNKLMMKELQSLVDRELASKEKVTILEAGCGSGSWLKFRPDARLVGIDISEKQLDRNIVLHEKILGNLETYSLPEKSYDLIMCWDVLEHLPHPEKALLNFFKSLNEGGLVLLAAPNVMALRGFITKYSPHWFHIFVYRYVYRRPEAGKEDQPPFVTYHRFSIAPKSIEKLAKKHNLEVVFEKKYQVQHVQKHPLVSFAWNAANVLLNILTLGMVETDRKSSFILVLQKGKESFS
ncbi:MAG: class I SAM-dependent methyltransferase [Bacteriovorax sp.]